jgi:sterol desaturase/sphingolipid hydroxylase (fatty acid hydroxylase superfamily)
MPTAILIQIPVVIAFVGLMLGTLGHPVSRRQLRHKPLTDWILDLLGLCVQGVGIPLLQTLWLYPLFLGVLPIPAGCLALPPMVSFLLSFVGVDYLYYWNHRCLHSSVLWPVHQVHHTVSDMDVLGTSRNTLWTSSLIIYLWVHPLWLYLLQDSRAYLLGVSLTAALDLWRHSRFCLPPQGWCYRLLSPWLILPQDHAWHHSRTHPNCNYGANLKLWDRWHGTAAAQTEPPPCLGQNTPLNLLQKLLLPRT